MEMRAECKACISLYAHDLYLRHKKEVVENGTPKILHKKLTPISKICTKCGMEKTINDFPYDKSRDNYGNICNACKYQYAKQKNPQKLDKLAERRSLLMKGTQICRYCKQIKPLSEMMKGSGTYTGVCRICNSEQRQLRYNDSSKIEEQKMKRDLKHQQKQERHNLVQQKRDLFAQGKRKCTKCGEVLMLAEFTAKHHPAISLQDYVAVCKRCVRKTYSKPLENKWRLQRNMQSIIHFINEDFFCDICRQVKPPYEMATVNKKMQLCKDCQSERHKQAKKQKNRNKKDTPYKQLICIMRNSLKDSLVGRKGYKTFVYLGCTGPELKEWLESQFIEGMSWDNRGIDGWHIDHYVPICYFDMSKEEDRFICWNYRNLRPLWGKENVDKGDSLPDDYLQRIEKIKKELHFPFDNTQTK